MMRAMMVLCVFAGMAVSTLPASAQNAPPAPAAMSAAELAEALRRAGVALPEGFEIQEDGSVAVPAPIANAIAADLAAAAAAANTAATPSAMIETPTDAPDATDIIDITGLEGGEGAVPAKAPPQWDHKIDLAANSSDGNSENTSFRIAYVGLRETETSRLNLDISYAYATQDGVSNLNRATAGINHDWLLKDSKWLYFAGGRADYDQFNSWRYRVNANGGVGYQLIEKENFELVLRAGAGLSREFGSNRDEIIPEGLLGADLRWDITENQSIIADTRYFPDLGDFTEFRTVSNLAWRLDLDNINDGLGITAGVSHRYQTVVDPGTEQTDIDLYAGVTWDF